MNSKWGENRWSLENHPTVTEPINFPHTIEMKERSLGNMGVFLAAMIALPFVVFFFYQNSVFSLPVEEILQKYPEDNVENVAAMKTLFILMGVLFGLQALYMIYFVLSSPSHIVIHKDHAVLTPNALVEKFVEPKKEPLSNYTGISYSKSFGTVFLKHKSNFIKNITLNREIEEPIARLRQEFCAKALGVKNLGTAKFLIFFN